MRTSLGASSCALRQACRSRGPGPRGWRAAVGARRRVAQRAAALDHPPAATAPRAAHARVRPRRERRRQDRSPCSRSTRATRRRRFVGQLGAQRVEGRCRRAWEECSQADPLWKCAPEVAHPALEPDAHLGWRTAPLEGDLVRPPIAPEPSLDDRPVAGRHGFERARAQARDLAALDLVGRIRAARHVCGLGARPGRALQLARVMGQDTDHPGDDSTRGIEASAALEDHQEGRLDQVLGIDAVARQAHGQRVQLGGRRVEERGQVPRRAGLQVTADEEVGFEGHRLSLAVASPSVTRIPAFLARPDPGTSRASVGATIWRETCPHRSANVGFVAA